MTTNDILTIVRKATADIRRKAVLTVARGVIELVDDALKMQSLQVTIGPDQVRDDVERFQEYGFTSVPKADCEAVVLGVGGNTDHPVVVATDDRRYRPMNLEEGEVALYTLQDAIRVLLKSDGEVHLGTSPSEFVALANLVKDEITALRDTVNSFVTTFNSHIHTTTATVGPSAVPGVIAPPTSPATAPATVGDVAAEEVKAT